MAVREWSILRLWNAVLITLDDSVRACRTDSHVLGGWRSRYDYLGVNISTSDPSLPL